MPFLAKLTSVGDDLCEQIKLGSTYEMTRDVGSISNLGGGGARHFEGTFFLKKKGPFSRNKKGTSLSNAKSWGGARAPSAPGSYVYAYDHVFLALS